jgi:hypothetical protein
VSLDRWGAPPGSVVVVDGYGPPDGRWLIVSVRRDYFAPTAEVSCRQPGKEKLEPANERGQRAANAQGGTATARANGDASKSARAVPRVQAHLRRGRARTSTAAGTGRV